MLFLCYPKCTTCQKARKWLDAKCVSYDYRDIKEENPSLEERAHTISGMDFGDYASADPGGGSKALL